MTIKSLPDRPNQRWLNMGSPAIWQKQPKGGQLTGSAIITQLDSET